MDQDLKTSPTVSVIIPTFNFGSYLREAVESVLRQTYPILELIIVDDGSTDDTESIAKSFASPVRYLKQENSGVSAARNFGVANASGDLIAFLDADDSWVPEKVEKQMARYASDPEIGLVHCGMREFDAVTGETTATNVEGEEGWVAADHLLFERSVINASGSVIMVRRDVFNEVSGFDHRLKNGEDWEFCLRVASRYKVGFVAEPLVNYRRHGINAHLNIREMERSTLIAWAKAFDTDDPTVLRLRRRSYGNLHKVLAASYLHYGNYTGFVRNVLKSLWYRPSYFGYYFPLLFRGRKN
jgi:glycosyltransferase involved in cell wall biosynthesis